MHSSVAVGKPTNDPLHKSKRKSRLAILGILVVAAVTTSSCVRTAPAQPRANGALGSMLPPVTSIQTEIDPESSTVAIMFHLANGTGEDGSILKLGSDIDGMRVMSGHSKYPIPFPASGANVVLQYKVWDCNVIPTQPTDVPVQIELDGRDQNVLVRLPTLGPNYGWPYFVTRPLCADG